MTKYSRSSQARRNSDCHFDHLTDSFSDRIYATPKGQIRLALLQEDLLTVLTDSPALRILDAGGGMGQMSCWLAGQGHQVTLCDASEPMLEKARHNIAQQGFESLITPLHSTLQDHCKSATEPYDLILCHAVLEWLTSPRDAVGQLCANLKPGGYLSLMFFNRHSLLIKNACAGFIEKVVSGNLGGDGSRLTPTNPVVPEALYGWLEEEGISLSVTTGVRCFYDYMPRKVRDKLSLEELLRLERSSCRQQPYLHMARYIHVLGRKSAQA